MCSLKEDGQFIFGFYVILMTILTRYATVVAVGRHLTCSKCWNQELHFVLNQLISRYE